LYHFVFQQNKVFMQTPITIYKKSKPAWLAVTLILAVGACGELLIVKVLFPLVAGFGDFKLSAAIAIALAVVFGAGLVIQQRAKGQHGLVIDERGIFDNSRVTSIGMVPWKDICGISEAKGDFKQPLIVVHVVNPDSYVYKTPKFAPSRQVLVKQFGSPVVISPRNLECDPAELKQWIEEGISSWGSSASGR
jgi:hypothetical protein